MIKTMKAKDALDYLVNTHYHIKSTLSDEIRKYLDRCGYDFYISIIKAKELIQNRFYVMDEDEEDYVRLSNMQLVLEKHFEIFTMIDSGMLKSDALIQINLNNK